MTTVAVYHHHGIGEQERELLRGFAKGIPGAEFLPASRYKETAVAVIYGLTKWQWTQPPHPVSKVSGQAKGLTQVGTLREALRENRMRGLLPSSIEKADIIQRHRGPIVVVERGFVKRDEYWAVGVDGIHRSADFRNREMVGDRWTKLQTKLEPLRFKPDGYVLLIGQVPWDVAVQESFHVAWLEDTASGLQRHGYDVRLRPHPLTRMRGIKYDTTAPIHIGSLDADLAGARAVIVWNSTTSVDATLAGVPVLAANKSAMVWPIAIRELKELDNLHARNAARQQWAYDLAYAQWTGEEMRSGEVWEHLARWPLTRP